MIKIIRNRYGGHIKLEKSILNSLINHEGVLCYQLYLGNKITYNVRTICEEEKTELSQYLIPRKKTVYIHAPLIANLSKVDEDDDIHLNSMDAISSLLQSVQGLPMAVVLHIGAKGELRKVIEHVNDLIQQGILVKGQGLVKNHLLLEVSAGSGTQLGWTWEEIEQLSAELDREYVGLCYDTAHMFGSGMCAFDSIESIDELFSRSEKLLNIGLIHINDSKAEFGSRKDRHEVLGRGYIWGSEKTRPMLDYFIKECFRRKIDLISETPDTDSDIKLMSEISNSK